MEEHDVVQLIKKSIEEARPNFRNFYRIMRKARVVKTYQVGNEYFADVQPLRNDDSVDPDEPIIPKVEIPIIWGGPNKGIICPPMVGTYCDIAFYDGDPNYPIITALRHRNNLVPSAEIGELVIQQQNGVHIRIKSDSQIEIKTPSTIKILSASKTIIRGGRVEIN